MTPRAGSFSAHFFLSRAARGLCAGQIVTACSMPKTLAGGHWRTLSRQPICYSLHGRWWLYILMAKRRGDKFKLWERVGSTEWKPGGRATEAAALAARAQFKQWVDYERNVQQRAAQARSAASEHRARHLHLRRCCGRRSPREPPLARGLVAQVSQSV